MRDIKKHWGTTPSATQVKPVITKMEILLIRWQRYDIS